MCPWIVRQVSSALQDHGGFTLLSSVTVALGSRTDPSLLSQWFPNLFWLQEPVLWNTVFPRTRGQGMV